jgi:Flp pilus assembly protein TadB
MSSESQEARRINAEQVTLLATSFLRKLGYSQGMRPKKASIEEDNYVVEIQLSKKNAKVQIDARTKEIKAYEIEEQAKEAGFALNRKTMILVAIPLIVVVVVVLKIAGILPF